MTRRDWLRYAGFAFAGLAVSGDTVQSQAAKVPRPTGRQPNETTGNPAPLSTRGRFLNWSPEEERYWFFSARDGLDRFHRLASQHRGQCELLEIARSAMGLPVFEFRLGRGPRRIALLSGMHGCEPSGPRGLLAYLDALLAGATPFDTRMESDRLLEAVSLHVFPLINPGGAQRFSEHFPDSWHGTWIPKWTPGNKEKFFAEGNEPNYFFYGTYVKRPPMRFAPEQIAEWVATGNVLGSSLTDDGLDMWFDWDETHGRETRALKDVLSTIRPNLVADFHNFMYPTEVFAPTVYSAATFAERERDLALAVQSAWRAHKLFFHDRSPRPYPKPAEKYYEDYWLHQRGPLTLIIEFNGGMLATEGAEYEPVPGQRALSRRESLASAFFAAQTLVDRLAALPA